MSNVLEAIKKTLSEIDEVLAKSGVVAKAEDEEPKEETPAEQPAPADPAEEMPASGAEEMTGEGEAPAPEASEAPEAEGEEDIQSEEESAEQHASSLSDEELDMMLQVLMAEKEKRSASQEAPEQKDDPTPQQDQLQMSLKEDYAKMEKSMKEMAEKLDSVTKELNSLKSAPKPAKITSKAAASNIKDVQVLEKSTPVQKRLSKSETIEFLQGQIRKRNPLVSTSVVQDIMYTNSDEELRKVQDELVKKGIEFPKF